jgi:two-component system CheB/CheR fusion protein
LESYYPHICEDYLPAFKAAIAQIDAERGMDVQVQLVRQDGVLQWLNIKGKAETDEHGRAIKLIGVINDITTDKLIERHKDDFISIASHELKTPVTSLKAALQLLDKTQEVLSDRVTILLAQANKGINRISSIIDDLLNAGKNYQEQIALQKTTFNLYDLAKEIGDQFIFANNQAIQLSGDKHLMIHADSERLGRVLTNLISNAVKYAPGSNEIKTEIQDEGNFVKVSVTDRGPGISAEKVPLLFDRYYQADSEKEQYSGLGLGLFISASIIRKHEGEIGVDSTPGQGTTFWFTLPK